MYACLSVERYSQGCNKIPTYLLSTWVLVPKIWNNLSRIRFSLLSLCRIEIELLCNHFKSGLQDCSTSGAAEPLVAIIPVLPVRYTYRMSLAEEAFVYGLETERSMFAYAGRYVLE